MLNILAIGLLAVIIRNPNMMESYEGGESLPTPLSNIDSYTTPLPPDSYYRDHSLNYRKFVRKYRKDLNLLKKNL